VEVIETLLKLVIIVPFGLNVWSAQVKLSVYLCCTLLLLWLSVLYPSFTNCASNSFRSAFYAVCASVAVVGLVCDAMRLSEWIPLVTALLIAVLGAFLGVTLLFARLQRLIPFMDLTQLFPWMAWTRFLPKRLLYRSRVQSVTTLFTGDRFRDILAGCETALDVDVVCSSIVLLRTSDSKRYALRVMAWAIENIFLDSAYLLGRFIVYLSYLEPEDKLVRIKIRDLMKRTIHLNPHADTRYFFWFLMIKWRLSSTAHETGEIKPLHILDNFRFQNNIQKARNHHDWCLKAALLFWKKASRRENANKLFAVANMFYFHQQEATRYYKCLVSQFPNSLAALRSFAVFMEDAVNSSEYAKELMEYASSIEDRRIISKQLNLAQVTRSKISGVVVDMNASQHSHFDVVMHGTSIKSSSFSLETSQLPKQESGSDMAGTSSLHEGSVTTAGTNESVTDIFDFDISNKRDKNTVLVPSRLLLLLLVTVAWFNGIVAILMITEDTIFIPATVANAGIINLVAGTRRASQALFMEARRLEMAVSNPLLTPADLTLRRNAVANAASGLKSTFDRISLYQGLKSDIINEAAKQVSIQLPGGSGDQATYITSLRHLVNTYVQNGIELSKRNFSTSTPVNSLQNFQTVMKVGKDLIVPELDRMLDVYKETHRSNISARFLDTTVTMLATALPALLMLLYFVLVSFNFVKKDGLALSELVSRLPNQVTTASFARIKQSIRQAKTSDMNGGGINSETDVDLELSTDPRKSGASSFLSAKWMGLAYFVGCIIIVGGLVAVGGLLAMENIKVQKRAFEVDTAGARRYLAVRACALSSELVRFDTVVWDDRDTIRDYLRLSAEMLMYHHLGVLYGNSSLKVYGSFGRDPTQDALLITPQCNDTRNMTCLGLDAALYRYLDLAFSMSFTPDQELKVGHPVLTEMLSFLSGNGMAMLERSVSLYVTESLRSSQNEAAKIAVVLYSVASLFVLLVLRQPLIAMIRRIQVTRSILFLLPMDSIIDHEDLRSYLLYGVLKMPDDLEDTLPKKERSSPVKSSPVLKSPRKSWFFWRSSPKKSASQAQLVDSSLKKSMDQVSFPAGSDLKHSSSFTHKSVTFTLPKNGKLTFLLL
jgi:hypothetical protein